MPDVRLTAERAPVVADLVHYVSYGTPGGEYTSQCRAAIVAAVYDEHNRPADPECVPGVPGAEWCALVVLNPSGMFFNDCCHDELTKSGGTWHWADHAH